VTAPVRWGFIGAGWIAHRALGPAVHCADGAVLQAVAARDSRRAQSLHPAGNAYDSYDALLADDDVEAVYISLNNDAHQPWTLRALEAGRHVLCEKPLGLTAAEVAEMAHAARRNNRRLVEATWSRWHPRTQRVQAMIATGAIGRVQSVDAGFTFPSVPVDNYRLDVTKGGGALYDIGPYSVGAVLWAVPDGDVEVVSAEVVRHESGVDLTTHATLRVGDVTASARSSITEAAGQWVRIIGDEATLVLEEPAHTSWLAPAELTLRKHGGDETLHFAPVDPYQLMVEHVSRAIRGDESAYVLSMGESLRAARALDAIRAASP
jgi:xylose dehydrogenase (NAD/NADP)